MSLMINADLVAAVLLVDGWHTVKPGTFDLDAYEFKQPDDDNADGYYMILDGGQADGVTSVGAEWMAPDDTHFFCPLTSILAVHYEDKPTRAKGTL